MNPLYFLKKIVTRKYWSQKNIRIISIIFFSFIFLNLLSFQSYAQASNVASSASVTCSSENRSTSQTCVKAIDGVIDGWPGDYTKEWATLGEGAGAWIMLDWGSTAYTIDRVLLYDRRNTDDQALSGILEFSDGTIVNVGSLPNDGTTPLQVNLSSPITITSMKFTVTSVSSNTFNVGLGEIEVYEYSPYTNTPPVANDDNVTTELDTAVTIDVLSNDTDPDPNYILSVDSFSQGTNGSVVVNPDESLTYTPDSGFSGTDTFTYIARDEYGATSNQAIVTVAVTLTPNNIALLSSVACSSQNTSTQQTCNKAIDGVVDGWPGDYTKEWATIGEKSGAWIKLTWAFPYTISKVVLYDRPNTYDRVLSGTLSFSDSTTVSVGSLPNDGTPLQINLSAPKTVSWIKFTVNSVSSTTINVGLGETEVFEYSPGDNLPPVANDDNVTTALDTAVAIDVLSNDTDPDTGYVLSIYSFSQGTSGAVVLNSDQTLTYTPNSSFTGMDSFTYIAKDEFGATSNEATVNVTVSTGNSRPLAMDDKAVTDENMNVIIDVLSNDIDWDGTLIPSSVAVMSGPSQGSTSIDSITGKITYIPNSGFYGLDAFTYTVEDNDGLQSNEVTVSVIVGNSPPIAVDDAVSTFVDNAVTIDVLSNDSDLNVGDILSISSATQGLSGSVFVNPNNTITYTPDVGFIGSDNFEYTVDDGNGGSDSGVVTVSVVNSVNNNITAIASATCSSENTSTQQNCNKAIDGVADGWPGDYTKEWATVGGKSGAWIKLSWDFPYTISKVILYDRPNTYDRVLSGTLSFSDGTTASVGSLPNDGTPLQLNLSAAKTTSWIKFTVNSVSSTTSNIGLSEIEVFGLSLTPIGYYVAIGDSITAGSHDDILTDGVGYEPILADLLTSEKGFQHVVINEGVSGYTSSDGLGLLPDILSAHLNAQYYLIQFGTNDAATPTPSGLGLLPSDSGYPGTFKYNIQQMITMVENAGKVPYLAKIPKAFDPYTGLNQLIQEYNQVINELVWENNITVIPPDFYCFFSQNPTQISSDGLHPNGTGYQSMAARWNEVLINQYGGCVP